MNRRQMLLLKVMEECNELSQRCSKGLRFTLGDIQPGQKLNNAERIEEEFKDLIVAFSEAAKANRVELTNISPKEALQRIKRIEKYMKYSKKLGTLK